MKMRRFTGVLVAAGAFGLFAMAAGARAQEAEVPLNQLPKAVADAARAKFPGARWREASKETEDGKTVYEVAMTHQGRKKDVTFQENGTLVLVETEVPEAELPPAVARAVKDKYPGAKVDLVESVARGPEVKTTADYYEFHLTTADKKSVEAEVDSQGKIVKTEEGKKD
jgi:hypothetical protein